MDDKLLLYNNSEPTLDAASKWRIAVDVALELTPLDTPADLRAIPWIANLGHLSDYADLIQQALARKEP